MDCKEISAAAFSLNIRKHRQDKRIEVFVASMADINKALAVKAKIDLRTKLPKQYWEFLELFDEDQVEKLPPSRGKQVDHKIELVQSEGKTPEVFWGAFYNMF